MTDQPTGELPERSSMAHYGDAPPPEYPKPVAPEPRGQSLPYGYPLQPKADYVPQPYEQPNPYGVQPGSTMPPPPSVYPPRTWNYVQPASSSMNVALVMIAWIIAVMTMGYMVPWAIAATRDRPNQAAIGVLNFFTGWSVIGWIASLVMACSNKGQPNQIVVVNQIYNNNQQGQQPPYRG